MNKAKSVYYAAEIPYKKEEEYDINLKSQCSTESDETIQGQCTSQGTNNVYDTTPTSSKNGKEYDINLKSQRNKELNKGNEEQSSKQVSKKSGRVQSLLSKFEVKTSLIEEYLLFYSNVHSLEEKFVNGIVKHTKDFNQPIAKPQKLGKRNKSVYKLERLSRPIKSKEEIIFNQKDVSTYVSRNIVNDLLNLYFVSLQFYFPMLKKEQCTKEALQDNNYFMRAICCISSRFSDNKQILAMGKTNVANRLYSISKKDAVSHYLNPNLFIICTNTLLTFHSFGHTDCKKLLNNAITIANILNKNYEANFFEPNVNRDVDFDRVWVFCLEVDRILALFYNVPMMSNEGFDYDPPLDLLTEFSIEAFPIFTYKLTLKLRRISNSLIQLSKGIPLNSNFKKELQVLNEVSYFLPKILDKINSPMIKNKLKGFIAMIDQMCSCLNLILYFPTLLKDNPSIPETLDEKNFELSMNFANRIYHLFLNDFENQPQSLSFRPPTMTYDLLIVGKFFKLLAQDLTNPSWLDFSIKLDCHVRLVNILKIFNYLSRYWYFATKCILILSKD